MEVIEEAKIPAQKFPKFNNSAIFADNTETAPENEDEEDEENRCAKMLWKMGALSFKTFFRDSKNREASASNSLKRY